MENKNKGEQLITIDDITFLLDDDEYRDAVENGYMPSYLYGESFPEKKDIIHLKQETNR